MPRTPVSSRGGVVTTATVSIRLPTGRFPRGSQAAALKDARPKLVADVTRAFAQARDPGTGKPWKPRTVQPGRRDDGHPLLNKTGRLKAAAVRAAEAAVVSGSTLVMRVAVPLYARFHAKGTRLMPRRRFAAASRATRQYLARRLAAAGLRVFRGGR